MPLPMILGHEAAGVVESTGEGVTSLKPGMKNYQEQISDQQFLFNIHKTQSKIKDTGMYKLYWPSLGPGRASGPVRPSSSQALLKTFLVKPNVSCFTGDSLEYFIGENVVSICLFNIPVILFLFLKFPSFHFWFHQWHTFSSTCEVSLSGFKNLCICFIQSKPNVSCYF